MIHRIAERAGTLALLAYTFGRGEIAAPMFRLQDLIHAGLRFPSLALHDTVIGELDAVREGLGECCRAHEAWRS